MGFPSVFSIDISLYLYPILYPFQTKNPNIFDLQIVRVQISGPADSYRHWAYHQFFLLTFHSIIIMLPDITVD